MPSNDLSGFILAGGRSRRMGRDKSQLPWRDQTLLTHAIGRMQQVCDRVFVLGETAAATVPVLKDVFPGDGPLAGLHAALLHSATEWNLVLAVDMPLVSPALLNFIASRCDTSTLAVVPKTGVHEGDAEKTRKSVRGSQGNGAPILQPLCAAYHLRFLPAIEAALSKRELSIRCLLEQTAQGIMGMQLNAIRVIDEHELTSAGFVADMLMNVNTPADFERAQRLAGHLNVD